MVLELLVFENAAGASIVPPGSDGLNFRMERCQSG